jgi:hypothetical protein
MKLLRSDQITPDATGLVCRQGRLVGAINALVLDSILVGAPIFWWMVGAPWFVWGGCALLALIVVPMLLGDLAAKFRDTNWLIWIRPEGVWINFRSYQDTGPLDVRTVVQLDYDEIEEAYRHIESYSTASGDGALVLHKVRSLEFRLVHSETDELQAALSENRRRKPPQRVVLGGIRISTRPSHYAVSLPAPDVLRVAWRGGVGSWVAPSLTNVLEKLQPYVCVAEVSRSKRGNWHDLSDADFDALVLELVEAGSRIEAIELLVRRRGYTTTEAHTFVEELNCRA